MLILTRFFNIASVAAFIMTYLELITPGRGHVGLYYCIASVFFAVLSVWCDDCYTDQQNK